MGYYFLTGATGLLGSYLLRDGLRAGRQIAVLARPSRNQPARARIEATLTQIEDASRTLLPRPVVIEGDLLEEGLGLDDAGRRWVARHCRAMIHNAASLTFQSTNRDQEPWLTNIGGTKRVLELCREAGITEFHHVSTAYTCGLRNGRILESELDVGQQFGNDYERSKVEAEKMVRNAGFLGSLTVYRPSILVGDSQTAQTTTFHGFYVPLRLAHTLVSRLALGDTAAETVIRAFGLKGTEHKNFVPVDWVSAVMSLVIGDPSLHGKTYNLVSQHPVATVRMARVVQDAVETYSTLADATDANRLSEQWFLSQISSEMEVYRAYWRDDPVFDDSNTRSAAPHLPCPRLDEAMLLRMARFAIDDNFGKARRRKMKLAFDAHSYLESGRTPVRWGSPNGVQRVCLGLRVDGPGGGQWKLQFHDGQSVHIESGISEQCSAVFTLDSQTFRRLVEGELSVARAVHEGHLRVDGNGLKPHDLNMALQLAIAPSVPASHHADQSLERCA